MRVAGFYRLINLLLSVFIILFIVSCDKDENKNDDSNDDNNNNTYEALSDGDFENWKTHTEGEVSYEVPESKWWGSLNMLKTLGCPLTMTKTTDAHTGNYAVKIETINWGDELIIPGIIAAGYFDKNQDIGENLLLGRDFEKKPDLLKGYFKYFPADQDTAILYSNLTKYNSETGIRDTIAEGNISVTDSITDYSIFEISYDYYITGQIPDTINVVFLTSISGQDFKGHVGSTLFIDDVELVYTDR